MKTQAKQIVKHISCYIVSICLLSTTSIARDSYKLHEESKISRTPINILGNWRISIIEIDGACVRVPAQAERADIQISNNQITGVVGCKSFMSPYTMNTNPQQLTIKDGASTKKMCIPEVMRFENAFLQIFTGNFMVEKSFEGINLVQDGITIHLTK